MKYNMNDALKFNPDDIRILEKNITPYVDKSEYFDRVAEEYDNNKLIPISLMEYKNFVLLEYFVEFLFGEELEKWARYDLVKNQAIELYKKTFNSAEKLMNDMNQAQEKAENKEDNNPAQEIETIQ